MSHRKAFKWAKTEYQMREFVDVFSYRLPVIVLLVVGWSGKDEEHTFGGGEIYRIDAVKRQRRVVAKHKSGYFVSIPTTINKKVDIFFPDGTVSPSASINDVQIALRIHSDGSLKMMFENDEKVSFSFGQDEGAEINFGHLKVIDVYDERYLVGHSLCDGNIYSPVTPVTIPVYMTIELSTAVGLEGGTKEDFCKVLADIEEQMKGAVTQVTNNNEIMLFPHDISDSDYEYIRPCTSMTAILRGSDLDMNQPDMTSSPAYDTPGKLFPVKLVSQGSSGNKRQKPPPPSPGITNKPPLPMPPMSGQPTRWNTQKTAQKKTVSIKKLPPEPSPAITNADVRTNDNNYDYAYTYKSDSSGNRLNKFATLKDVPLDIRILPQDQLVTCMQMLKISEPSLRNLAEQGVDGNILVGLDESILVEEFHFGRFDAIKLMRFAKDGYRP